MVPQYVPMAPTLVREPFHRDGWIYEEKVDGWRMLAYKSGDRVRLVNRNGRDNTRRFADLPAAIAELSARSLVLDGEVAIFDQQLRSRFEWLRDTDPDVVPRHRLAAGDGHPAAPRLAPVADRSVPSTETERGHA